MSKRLLKWFLMFQKGALKLLVAIILTLPLNLISTRSQNELVVWCNYHLSVCSALDALSDYTASRSGDYSVDFVYMDTESIEEALYTVYAEDHMPDVVIAPEVHMTSFVESGIVEPGVPLARDWPVIYINQDVYSPLDNFSLSRFLEPSLKPRIRTLSPVYYSTLPFGGAASSLGTLTETDIENADVVLGFASNLHEFTGLTNLVPTRITDRYQPETFWLYAYALPAGRGEITEYISGLLEPSILVELFYSTGLLPENEQAYADADGQYALLIGTRQYPLESDCRTSGFPRVGANRRLTLSVKNHIYVAGDSSEPWNPNGWTCLPQYSPFCKSRNSDLVRQRVDNIEEVIDDTNRIFADTGLNVILFDSGYDVIANNNMIIAEFASWLGWDGWTDFVVSETRKNAPGLVHVHWSWWSDSAVRASGEAFNVVIGDDHMDGVTYAHEIVHSLGYLYHETGPCPLSEASRGINLMSDTAQGAQLNACQIAEIWNTLNDPDLTMNELIAFVSCRTD